MSDRWQFLRYSFNHPKAVDVKTQWSDWRIVLKLCMCWSTIKLQVHSEQNHAYHWHVKVTSKHPAKISGNRSWHCTGYHHSARSSYWQKSRCLDKNCDDIVEANIHVVLQSLPLLLFQDYDLWISGEIATWVTQQMWSLQQWIPTRYYSD